MLHCCVGSCATVRNGARAYVPAFVLGRVVDFPRPLGPYEVFELGHAEPATIPKFMPGLRNLRTMGAIHPPYLNGLFRGIARQVDRGSVGMNEAVDFIVALDAGSMPYSLKLSIGVLSGMLSQLIAGEIRMRDPGGLLQAVTGKLQAEAPGASMSRSPGQRRAGARALPRQGHRCRAPGRAAWI